MQIDSSTPISSDLAIAAWIMTRASSNSNR
ncbi:Uncharacterised protein [Bordetella pertussis]|nr:Uncharacterised protein [Bordetella pertussis]